jgi:ubiquinone/menaquinone biosynthesis C-methylase UbiE
LEGCRRTLSAVDWSRVAPSYDRQLPLERAALAAAVTLAQPRRDDLWLDVGTGTGGLLRELTRRSDRPQNVVGVDACAAMLERAQALPKGWVLKRVDARRLPFADGAFSVVTAAYLLHVVDPATRRQIIGECRRVLHIGGRLVIVTPAWPRTWVARMLYAPLAAAAGRSVGPAAALRPLDPRGELEEAMFTIAAVRYVGRGYPSLCVSATR